MYSSTSVLNILHVPEQKPADQESDSYEFILRSHRKAWEDAPVPMRLSDSRGTILLVNKAYCRLVGRDRNNLEGSSVAFPGESEEINSASLAGYVNGFTGRSFPRLHDADLQFHSPIGIHLDISHLFVSAGDGRTLLLTLFRDATEECRMRGQLHFTVHERFRSLVDDAHCGIGPGD